MAQSHVQTVTQFKNSSTTTVTQAFGATSTHGNLIVVHLSYDKQSISVNTVTDNNLNTYTRINGPTNWNGTNYRSELWYAFNIHGGATISITATLTGSSNNFFQIYMSEYSGIATTNPLDQHSVATGTTAAVSSGAKTTGFAGELIYGVSIGASGNLSVGAGFSARSTANQNIVEDKIGTTISSYDAKFNSAGGQWVAEMATFKPLINLPIKLVSFDAKLTSNEEVKIDWATAIESNNNYFEVQRSADGASWVSVAKVPGAINSNTLLNYSITDRAPYAGLSYYRLLQFDLDGHSQSSEVVSVRTNAAPEKRIKVYPVPANNYITIEGNSGDLQNISIVNTTGQPMNDRVRMTMETDSKTFIDLSLLPKGIYFIKTKTASSSFYKQ